MVVLAQRLLLLGQRRRQQCRRFLRIRHLLLPSRPSSSTSSSRGTSPLKRSHEEASGGLAGRSQIPSQTIAIAATARAPQESPFTPKGHAQGVQGERAAAAWQRNLDRRDAHLPNLADKVHKLKRGMTMHAYNNAALLTTICVDCWITEQHLVDLIDTTVVSRRAAPEPGGSIALDSGGGKAQCLLVFVARAGIHELFQRASSYFSKPGDGDDSHLFFLLQITRKISWWSWRRLFSSLDNGWGSKADASSGSGTSSSPPVPQAQQAAAGARRQESARTKKPREDGPAKAQAQAQAEPSQSQLQPAPSKNRPSPRKAMPKVSKAKVQLQLSNGEPKKKPAPTSSQKRNNKKKRVAAFERCGPGPTSSGFWRPWLTT
uniref:Uncharacterized protein n=1 Tax=Oryza barthii TaxID=65489 RepID=A0A0D3H4Q6_9ORYZ